MDGWMDNAHLAALKNHAHGEILPFSTIYSSETVSLFHISQPQVKF